MTSWLKFTVLFWSTFSGVIMGLLAGVVIGAIAFEILTVLPTRFDATRLRTAMIIICLVVLPTCGAVLGFLEGRLKLS